MEIAILGIDLGKNSCSIVGFDDGGAVVLRRRMRREGVIKFAGKLRPCVVAMEACCGAHHLGRVLRAQGHEVRLMSLEYGLAGFAATEAFAQGSAATTANGVTRKILSPTDGPASGYETIIMDVTLDPGATVARHTHPGI